MSYLAGPLLRNQIRELTIAECEGVQARSRYRR